MGLFNRRGRDEGRRGARGPDGRPAEGAATDHELTFLTPEKADRFRATVRRVLAEDGYEVTVHPGVVVTDDGREFGLWNVAAVAHGAEGGEDEWPDVVRGHFGPLLRGGLTDPDDLSDDDYLAALRMRLVEAESVASLDGFDHALPWAETVVRLPVVDLPETVATPPASELRRHGELGPLLDRAFRNTAALVDTEELLAERVEHEGHAFTCVLGDSFFTASLALVLPDLVHRFEPDADLSGGVIFSVPFRHQLNFKVVRTGADVTDALLLLPRFSVAGFEDSPGPLSPHVYLWRDGEVSQLTRISAGSIDVVPGPYLESLLDEEGRAGH